MFNSLKVRFKASFIQQIHGREWERVWTFWVFGSHKFGFHNFSESTKIVSRNEVAVFFDRQLLTFPSVSALFLLGFILPWSPSPHPTGFWCGPYFTPGGICKERAVHSLGLCTDTVTHKLGWLIKRGLWNLLMVVVDIVQKLTTVFCFLSRFKN